MGSFIEMVDGLAKQVEQEKMKAIGARNLLKSIAKEREAQKQQLQALIAEKKMQLERCSAVGYRPHTQMAIKKIREYFVHGCDLGMRLNYTSDCRVYKQVTKSKCTM